MTAASSFRAIVPVAGAVLMLLAPLEMEWRARSALAIATAMILCWMMDLLHPALVGFIGCFLFRAIGDVDFEGAFAGFGTETPWFLYGTLLLIGAADRSGLVAALGARTPAFARAAIDRELRRGKPRPFAAPFLPPAVALIALAYALAFVVPSALARAAILAIPALAWSNFGTSEPRNLGTSEPRNLGPWLVLVAAYSAAMFGHPDLPGGPLSIIGWDVAAAIAVVVGGVFWALRLRPPASRAGQARRAAADDDAAPPVVATAATHAIDFKIAAPLALAIALWVTTPFHGVSPALVGLGCGLLCCLPGIAPDKAYLLNADHLAVVFLGTAISIPAVLVETRAAEALAALWSSANTATGFLPQDIVAYWSTTAYRVFSPDGARPPLPPLDAVLGSAAIWSYAGSTLLSLHQSPALVLAMSVGGCRAKHVLTVGALVFILGSIVIMSLP